MADELPLVGVIMGSKSDWATMHHAADLLTELGVPFELKVVSAPDAGPSSRGAEARRGRPR